MKTDIDLAQPDRSAIGNGLRLAGEIRPAPDRHDGKRFLGGENPGMARPRMIGMAMRNECARHRSQRIDVEIAGAAIKPGGCEGKAIGGAHDVAEISASCLNLEACRII